MQHQALSTEMDTPPDKIFLEQRFTAISNHLANIGKGVFPSLIHHLDGQRREIAAQLGWPEPKPTLNAVM